MARLRGADVFCAPSLHGESFGVVLIEAMAAETAIVASGLDGYRNVATDEVDALLVEPGDVDALAVGAEAGAVRTGPQRRVCSEAGSLRAERFLDDRAGQALRRALRATGDESPDAGPSADQGVLLAQAGDAV